MSHTTISAVPSSRRTVQFQMRQDLSVTPSVFQGEQNWVVKDGLSLRYFRLQPVQHCVLSLLDGRRNLEEIRGELQLAFPAQRPTLADVQHLIDDFYEKGLLVSNSTGQGAVLLKRRREQRRKSIGNAIRNMLYIRLPGWDPDRLLSRIYPSIRWVFDIRVAVVAMATILAAWLLLAVQFDHFLRRLPEFEQFFGWPNLIYLWIAMGLAKISHEFAHGLACKHYGSECHEIGVAFLVFSPCLYCDVSDSWMLPKKWQRIAIAAAGMPIEILISAIALFVWWNTNAVFLHHLCLNIFFVTTISTVIYNANPLLRFDGYYILCDLLEISNLRAKSERMLRQSFSKHCLGIEPPADPFMPKRGKHWFVVYAIAAALYRWFLMFAITYFLYEILKPYGLQNLGLALGLFSMASILGNLGYHIYRIISEPRMKPINPRRAMLSLLSVASVAAVLLFLPLPLRCGCALLVEPRGIEHIYANTPGILSTVSVRPGQYVRRGEELAWLSSFVKELQYEKLMTAGATQKVEISKQRYLADPAREKLATETLKSIEQQRDQYERQLCQLIIVAPCDGVVVAAPALSRRTANTGEQALSRWSGTPLEAKNLGCWLDAGTHLLSVAPETDSQAVLLIDQIDRNDVNLGQMVEIKLDHRPGKTYRGEISAISLQPRIFAPKALSNKFGGDIPTVTDSSGRERLTSDAYEAVVLLGSVPDPLLPGTRGTGRVTIETRTAGQWIWRYLCRTVNFRL